MGPLSYMRSVIDWNIVMQHMTEQSQMQPQKSINFFKMKLWNKCKVFSHTEERKQVALALCKQDTVDSQEKAGTFLKEEGKHVCK